MLSPWFEKSSPHCFNFTVSSTMPRIMGPGRFTSPFLGSNQSHLREQNCIVFLTACWLAYLRRLRIIATVSQCLVHSWYHKIMLQVGIALESITWRLGALSFRGFTVLHFKVCQVATKTDWLRIQTDLGKGSTNCCRDP